jgi:hypothetical protein
MSNSNGTNGNIYRRLDRLETARNGSAAEDLPPGWWQRPPGTKWCTKEDLDALYDHLETGQPMERDEPMNPETEDWLRGLWDQIIADPSLALFFAADNAERNGQA